MQTADLNFNAKMSNELAMDILNGEGPDILLNCSNYGQLNNTNYLADLSTYVGTLDSDKYFTNIVDAAKIDGKLYQFPVCYMVSGIFTDAKYAGKSGVGFTTAEYEKFLNDTLNGKDVINYGQAQYFTRLRARRIRQEQCARESQVLERTLQQRRRCKHRLCGRRHSLQG